MDDERDDDRPRPESSPPEDGPGPEADPESTRPDDQSVLSESPLDGGETCPTDSQVESAQDSHQTESPEPNSSSSSEESPRSVPREPAIGSWIDGRYEIRRRLGRGAAGAVYLARDVHLGRRVAVKVLRSGRETTHGAERLTEEGRALCQVNHPHIITLFDFGVVAGLPYLSLEYMEGGTLRDRMASGPLGESETVRHGLAIAHGLAAVHARGILHRDLKPSNILFTADGRPKVGDFGLAMLTGRMSGRVRVGRRAGTIAYMSPEQWAGGEVGPAVDIWALGCIIYEMVTGHRPYASFESTEDQSFDLLGQVITNPESRVPDDHRLESLPRLRSLVHSLLQCDPDLRPTTTNVAHSLEGILHPVRVRLQDDNPFVGLASFGEDQAEFFFGRGEAISAVVERLRGQPVLAVHGRSGVGKTSLLRAGVLPRLKHGPRAWTAVCTRPGRAGLIGLARDVLSTHKSMRPISAEDLAAAMRLDPLALSRYLFERARSENTRIVVYVDQFEEVVTHDPNSSDWETYARAVALAADDASDPVRVILSVRDDFLSRFDSLPEVSRVFGRGFLLGPPDEHSLLECLSRPVDIVGYRFDDPTLPATMVQAVRNESAALPLLQFALARLWERRDPGTKSLLVSEYEAMGGVEGALAQHANQLVEGLSTERVVAVRGLLLGLVSDEGTRLVRSREDLLRGLGPEASEQLDRLCDARLVSSARHEGGSYELVHESLIRRWDWLARELDATAEERGFVLRLEAAARNWDESGRAARYAWDADPVRESMRWGVDLLAGLTPVGQAFVAASQTRAITRRRGQVALAVFAVLLILLMGAALVMSAQMSTISANIGAFDLRLQPFDWTDRTYTTSPVSAGELPNLGIRLYRVSDEHTTVPGLALDGDLVDIDETGPGEFRISAPGYPTILEVYGRNRVGKACSSSWVRLQDLPGYGDTESGAVPEFEIPVPTCDASQVGMAQVPTGLVYVPPGDVDADSESFGSPVRVEGVWMDEFEITNRKYSVMLPTSDVTGVTDMPQGILDVKPDPTGADMPRSWVNYYEAANYCRFLGKRLPTRAEFVRAARGSTRRSCSADVPECWVACNVRPPPDFNDVQKIAQPKDFFSVEPGAFLNCEGPFGHYDLTGNVGEWSADLFVANSAFAHYLGSEAYLPFRPWESGVSYPNIRAVGFKDANSGFRCVSD